ncbi:MAG: biopolymer transporter ExbD [Burkholderiales bacterium 66-5]|uniref:ExbD/TolR family protein n=1 Tax=Comamonas badia TaxID=265291 RepID=UPI0003F72906|nr:biopolymer transporter ExbD [Comamonas badia]OJU89780.1 MAG: biopolymer transporter ExbD [Burkholderiales bacterium 66-5]
MAFGRFSESAQPRPMGEINVTPLVDVMLVLVVIFILAAPLLASGIRLDLPHAASAQPGASASAITVVLDRAGGVFVDDAPIAADALAERLKRLAAQQPGAELQLRADAAVPYGRVVELIGMAQAAGLARIGFAAQPEKLLEK